MQSGWNTKTQTMEIYVIILKIDGPQPVILEELLEIFLGHNLSDFNSAY